MDYDVLILGGGIIGCAVAYEISKYNLNIAVIEKDYDIADDGGLALPSTPSNTLCRISPHCSCAEWERPSCSNSRSAVPSQNQSTPGE